MNLFEICGIVLALWALVVSFLGITRENFPSSPGAERLVGLISAVLVVLAIGSGIYTAATEEHDEPEGDEAALVVLPG